MQDLVIPMKMKQLLAASMLAVLCLSGCKLVKTDAAKEGAGAGPGGDQERVATLVATTFDSKLVPALKEKAVDLPALQAAIKGGLDAAGAAHGVRVGGAGGGWNFPVKATGVVVEEDLSSKAAVARIDVDGDGKADAVLQLGPVVKGTAIRDTTTLYDFSTFRDQIEFARLGRALNDKAVSTFKSPEGGLKGKTLTILGATTIRAASEQPLITPVSIEVAP
jgi:predicted lipoprotein